jgi:hypothetical protein
MNPLVPKQINPAPDKVKETTIVGSIKVIETEYQVKSPVFQDVVVERPIFVDKKIEIPSEWDKVIDELTHRIADRLMDKVELVLGARLDRAIDQRIKEIKSPKIVEELVINKINVDVQHPVFTDIEVQRPVFKEYEVKNPVIKDVEVINAVIVDRTVINSIITDQKITNAIITDVPVERAVIREKVVDVIHPRYLKLNGEPE